MPGLYGVLNTGKGALLTQQKAVDVTGHNIANANTLGFSRQRLNLETNEPISMKPGQMGTGVRAREIQRIYDKFLGVQINNENKSLGRWESQKDALERVEMIFDESTGFGLNQAMSEFWNAWQDLVNNPTGLGERSALLAKTEQMTQNFQKVHADLRQIQDDIDDSIKGIVEEINLITPQIADLNRKISQVEIGGQNANDYRDKRDLLLQELSLKIDINSFENDEGKMTVMVCGGRPLVENTSAWDLSTETVSGHENVVWIDGDGNSVDITSGISGGKLKGWIETRDVAIPDYSDRLDTLAQEIITQVNGLHASGFGLSGSTGNDFFNGTSASDIEVNPAIIADKNLIAAAGGVAWTGQVGDNSNAIAIANLQNTLTMNAGTATFDDYFNSLVSDVGSAVQTATTNFDHETVMLIHLNNHKESISGVSLDEEMINLVKFQHAYDSAAKLISTVDELLATVINMV